MTDQEYKERLHAFRNSCRVYRQEKEILENAQTARKTTDPTLIKYMQDDVDQVEYILGLARELFGTSAVLMIWLLMVEEKTQAAAAYQLNITRRQLQYTFSKYMHRIFEEERIRGIR